MYNLVTQINNEKNDRFHADVCNKHNFRIIKKKKKNLFNIV